MSALSPINAGAPALFRFARRFFKKSWLESLLSAERMLSARWDIVPVLPSNSRYASDGPAPRHAVVADRYALCLEMRRNNNLRTVDRLTLQLLFHLDIIG
jgi:hypothetical protein